MDYAIFLLHRFSDYREEGHSIEEAMRLCHCQELAPILSSVLTTFFGFLTLVFMLPYRPRSGHCLGQRRSSESPECLFALAGSGCLHL